MSRLEGNAASGKAPRLVVNGGRELRARGSPAVLRAALASAFTLGRGVSPLAVAHGSGQRMEKGIGEAWPL